LQSTHDPDEVQVDPRALSDVTDEEEVQVCWFSQIFSYRFECSAVRMSGVIKQYVTSLFERMYVEHDLLLTHLPLLFDVISKA